MTLSIVHFNSLRLVALTLEFVVSAVFTSGTLRAYYEPRLSQ
ncbi:MAG: hypothetical protein RID53_01630 [Coleofasciculus sp. B1-GNL1-01]